MKRLLASLGIVAAVIFSGSGVPMLHTPQAQALTIYKPCSSEANAKRNVCKATNKDDLIGDVLTRVINTLLFVIGIIAVIVIIVGAIRFATSGGDPGQAASARNTIIYAVVGLVVAVMAYAIVNFVLNHIG